MKIAGLLECSYVNRPVLSLNGLTAEISHIAEELYLHYARDKKQADAKYLDKVVGLSWQIRGL